MKGASTCLCGIRQPALTLQMRSLGPAGFPNKPLATLPAFASAVTALAFAPKARPPRLGSYAATTPERAGPGPQSLAAPMGGSQGSQTASAFWLAVGLESGGLEIWTLEVAAAKLEQGSGEEGHTEVFTSGGRPLRQLVTQHVL